MTFLTRNNAVNDLLFLLIYATIEVVLHPICWYQMTSKMATSNEIESNNRDMENGIVWRAFA